MGDGRPTLNVSLAAVLLVLGIVALMFVIAFRAPAGAGGSKDTTIQEQAAEIATLKQAALTKRVADLEAAVLRLNNTQQVIVKALTPARPPAPVPRPTPEPAPAPKAETEAEK